MRKSLLLFIMFVVSLANAVAQTNFRELSVEDAIGAARVEGKLVFIDFYTDWCGPCKMMARQVFPQKEVGDYMNKTFVCIKLNAEKEGKADAARFRLMAYPTFIILNSEDKEIGRHEGGTPDGQKFVGILESIVNPDLSTDKMVERYNSGDRAPKLIRVYANALVDEAYQTQQSNKKLIDRAINVINDYFNNLPDADKWKADNNFVFSTIYCSGSDDPKLAFVNSNIKKVRGDSTYSKMLKMAEDHYLYATAKILSCETKYDEADYGRMKKDIAAYGYENGQYDAAFDIIEAHADGDMNHYLDVCDKQFAKLSAEMQEPMLMNFGEILGNDKAVLSRGAKFMRRQFLTVSATTIFFSARELNTIEKKLGL